MGQFKILKNNAWYQTNVTRPKKFLSRKHASQGVGLLAYADPCYIQLPNKKIWKFLIVADSCSKFVFGAPSPPKKIKTKTASFSFGEVHLVHSRGHFLAS